MTTDNDNKCVLGIDPIAFGRMLESIEAIKGNTEIIRKRLDQQNGRIGRLENWRSYLFGAMAILAFVIPVIVKYVL